MATDPDLVAVLDRLEDLEMQLLSWGIVDGGFSEQEIIEVVESTTGLDGQDALDDLEKYGLIFEARIATGRVWRTRMAETVRLLTQLRQLFPQRSWRTAPKLVGDYRLEIGPRHVPRRNIVVEDLVASLSQISGWRQDLESPIRNILAGNADGAARHVSDFQRRATQSVLRGLTDPKDTATVVCAGTGSGKTLSFYLPALAEIATLIDQQYWVKALALYPRNELLKDQLRTALQECERLAEAELPRRILVGAYFGPTPQRPTARLLDSAKWGRVGEGYVCPFVVCLDDECNSRLIWRNSDLENRIERLVCERCGRTIESDQIALSRDRMRRTPPDLLFASAEMLNRTLSDTTSQRCFGVGVRLSQRPRLLLLDEIHTYSGVSGAQVALLLRRWRRAVAAPLHIVGLSATLDSPVEFMEQLTGLRSGSVELVEPREAELDSLGKQYSIALRGDPASQTALLSASIQSAMLLRRMLDTYEGPRSKGLYGQKLFVFTDNLDVTNRMFFQLRDAEGMTEWGDPRRDGRPSLATLRNAGSQGDALERELDGQVWRFATQIGHPLISGPLLSITRTSSQDAGVDGLADMVVATAALEVGFDDPTVGAVLQHKAPRDAAQFLQRRGRAGRPIQMRPWTVVVLSDYGRDRVAFQSYEQLFNPRLRKRALPVSNRYVLRMQATFAFMDWVSGQLRLRGLPYGSVWSDLAGPADRWQRWRSKDAKVRQQAAHGLILEVLQSPDRTGEVAKFLERALDVEADEVAALMWEPPRSLMLEVLPTLARRLESDWYRTAGTSLEAGGDLQSRGNPMPDFVPPNLFTDLNLPEITVEFPADAERPESSIGSLQGLREFAPGRVTHRYAVRYGGQRQWVVPPDYEPAADGIVEIAESYDWDEIGTFAYHDQSPKTVRCVRPRTVRPTPPPKDVEDRTNAFPIWHWEIIPQGEGLSAALPARSMWAELIRDMNFFLHNMRSQVEVRRFMVGSKAEVAVRGRTAESVGFSFAHEGQSVALGVVLDVDGLRVGLNLPEDLSWFELEKDDKKLRSLRTQRFAYLLDSDPRMVAAANKFQRDWLAQLMLSAVAMRAIEAETTFESAVDEMAATDLVRELQEVLKVIFRSLEGEDDEEISDRQEGRLIQSLSTILSDAGVREALVEHARLVAADADPGWMPWLRDRLKATIGAALLQGIQLLCPDFDIGDLALDLHPGGVEDPAASQELWVTETTIGGAGVLEEFFQRYSEDPRRFFRLVESALAPSDNEIVDRELSQMLGWMSESEVLRSLANQVRNSNSHEERVRAWQTLQRDLRDRGMFLCHPVIVGVSSRLLRPGGTPEIDLALNDLIRMWDKEEARLGIELDLRVLAYAASGAEQFEKALMKSIPDGRSMDRQWRFSVLTSLLWPRGGALRSHSLTVRSSFADLPVTDSGLLSHRLVAAKAEVDVANPGWQARLEQQLQGSGNCWLVCPTPAANELRDCLQQALGTAVHIGFLELFPHVSAVRRTPGEVRVLLELDEVEQ